MIGTAFFYLATDQWRYDTVRPTRLASPPATGPVRRADPGRLT